MGHMMMGGMMSVRPRAAEKRTVIKRWLTSLGL